eukprot:7704784-Pyramimonas_sp.AAC.1
MMTCILTDTVERTIFTAALSGFEATHQNGTTNVLLSSLWGDGASNFGDKYTFVSISSSADGTSTAFAGHFRVVGDKWGKGD